jgi:hypothetical protein
MLSRKFRTFGGKTFLSANFQRRKSFMKKKKRRAHSIMILFLLSKEIKTIFSKSFIARQTKFYVSVEYSYCMLPNEFSSDRVDTFCKFSSLLRFSPIFAIAKKRNFCKKFISWKDEIFEGIAYYNCLLRCKFR